MLDRPYMQRIISLFAALMIFFFSVVGEGAHASPSNCPDMQISQHSSNTSLPLQILSTADFSTHPEGDRFAVHGCHFGHCAFTLLLQSAISSPTPLKCKDVEMPYFAKLGEFPSESLRPPSAI